MGTMRQLNGIVHNLADSFGNAGNNILFYIESTVQTPEVFEVDLLSKKKSPIVRYTAEVNSTLERYNTWFKKELEKARIDESRITSATVQLTYTPGEGVDPHFACMAKIVAEGKEYLANAICRY